MKKILKKFIPKYISYKFFCFLYYLKSFGIKNKFRKTDIGIAWLDEKDFKILQSKFQLPPQYKYDKKNLEIRGQTRGVKILKLLNKNFINKKKIKILEIGCHDGMVCYALNNFDKSTIGIDINLKYLNSRAKNNKINFIEMDACGLAFNDNSFDMVYSYASFEHFKNPEKVLNEVIRIVQKRGLIYLDFGPLYMSPYGLHAYDIISIPFCQHLFEEQFLKKYAKQNHYKIIYEDLNRWKLEDYRKLWNKYSSKLTKISYSENKNFVGLELIKDYPSCFKDKSINFDEFVTSSIEVLFKKMF